ncbi:vitellogenin-like protein [Thalictrum thalictroides]|uniref:Vitellogenin-like protein n=1 Tax=Thalictrum thalictroides TaxID=46969 RepID=A0A7J6UU96_THATH|nr:vitellogenin-like protein [Thalictrum thalictroides]
MDKGGGGGVDGGGGGGAVVDDMGESMQCSNHPYKNNPGGICAFCLQEKLGKLLSSTQSNPSFFPSSSSPSFRSDASGSGGNGGSGAHVGLSFASSSSSVLPKKMKKVAVSSNFNGGSKDKCVGESSSSARRGDYGDENESPNSSHASSSSFGRKVARSRSVGCGSRSFSGDLLERISTGFGDCTLRRVESQREAKHSSKGAVMRARGVGMGEHHHRIKERVKCGGIFGGFSSSSSSSSHWASSSEDVNHNNVRVVGIEHHMSSVTPHGRSKSWGWAFASPMRAFRSSSKPEDKNTANSSASTNKGNAITPNLAAIPSLLTVRS